MNVPEKYNFLREKETFLPGPGRYMTFIRKGCYMCKNKIIKPFVTNVIEREKRMKFRRLPYMKINAKKYCDTQFSHIPGHGFPHIFKVHATENRNLFIPKEHKQKTQSHAKEYVRYADAGYIRMINNPGRNSTLRTAALEKMPVKIVYNCLARRIKRKHLTSNKKIAFMSGQTRWKDGDRRSITTVSQNDDVKSRLPKERRLTNYPVMFQPIEKIKGKLYETPDHMRPAYTLGLRKIHFKFQPIPDPKILVLDEELRPHHVDGKYVGDRFFFKTLNAEDFIKTNQSNAQNHNYHPQKK